MSAPQSPDARTESLIHELVTSRFGRVHLLRTQAERTEAEGYERKLRDLVAPARLSAPPTCEICRNDAEKEPGTPAICGYHYGRLVQRLAEEEDDNEPADRFTIEQIKAAFWSQVNSFPSNDSLYIESLVRPFWEAVESRLCASISAQEEKK